MTKKVFLHIGMHKTGTTALQIFLFNNMAKIPGYYYPLTGRPNRKGIRYGHHDLPWSLVKKVDKGRDILWEELLNEIKGTDSENIVISSEEFDILREEHVCQVKQYLSELDVQIIVYLRRQDQFAQASYSTNVRKGKISLHFDDYLKKIMKKLNYYNLVKRWAEQFGEKNVRVRVYSGDRLIEKNTISDFCTLVGIDSLNGFILPKKDINRGLPRNILEILRLMNSLEMPKTCLDDINRIANVLYPVHMSYDIMAPYAAKKLIDRFENSNKRVLEEFLGGTYETLFPLSADCESTETWEKLYGMPYGDIRKTISDLKDYISGTVRRGKFPERTQQSGT